MNRNFQGGTGRGERQPRQDWADEDPRYGAGNRDEARSAPYGRDYPEAAGGWRGTSQDRPLGREYQSDRAPRGDDARWQEDRGQRGEDYTAGMRDRTDYDEGQRWTRGHGDDWGYGEYASERDVSGHGRRSVRGAERTGGSQGRWSSMRGEEDYSDDAGWGSGRGYGNEGRGVWGRGAEADYGAGRDFGGGEYGGGMARGGSPSDYAQGRQDRGYGGTAGAGYARDAHFTGAHGGPGAGRGPRSDWGDADVGRSGYRGSRSGEYGGDRGNDAHGDDRSQWGRGSAWAGGQPEARDTGFRGRGPKGYRRSDERVKEDLCERLSDDPRVDASGISVEVADGKVTLTGEVEQRWMKHHVENLVDACSGVQDIDNQLRVSRSQGNARAVSSGGAEAGSASNHAGGAEGVPGVSANGNGGGSRTTGAGATGNGGAGTSSAATGAGTSAGTDPQRRKQ